MDKKEQIFGKERIEFERDGWAKTFGDQMEFANPKREGAASCG
jgi:hypothetical protein